MLKVIDEAVDVMIKEQNNTTQENTQEKILKLIEKNPNITQTEMANALGITRDRISYNIIILKNNGIIERIGFTKKEFGK